MSKKNSPSSSTSKFWNKPFSSSELLRNGKNSSSSPSPPPTGGSKANHSLYIDESENNNNSYDPAYYSDVPPHSTHDGRVARSKSVSAKTHHRKLHHNATSDDILHHSEDPALHSLSSKFKTLFKPSETHANDHAPSRNNSKSSNSKNINKNSRNQDSSPRLPSPKNGQFEEKSMTPVVETETEYFNRDEERLKVEKQLGHLVLYTNGEHEHLLKKAKLLEKPVSNLIPGGALLSALLKPKSGGSAGNEQNSAISIFSEAPELKLLQELKARKLQNSGDLEPLITRTRKAKLPLEPRRQPTEDRPEDVESDGEDSEPEVVDAAIDKPQLELINKLVNAIDEAKFMKAGQGKDVKLSSEYGVSQGICGRGSYGVVKIVSKIDPKTKKEKFFAVKELKQKSNESPGHFSKRLISEFIISLSLNHCNIVKTYDLMRNSKGVYSEVLEYCDAGDLYTLIAEAGRDGLHYIEADCFFKQLLNGVIFMHSKGIAHCDLKPENVLLQRDGACKIIDFGTSAVFKTAWEKDIHLSHGVCGSEPYVAPEEYVLKYYDPRLTDVWALGVLYMVMRVGTYLWQKAKEGQDDLYEKYLKKRPYEDDDGYYTKGSFEPIESLKDGTDREVIRSKIDTLYDILEPDPEERMTTLDIYKTSWISSVSICRRHKE